MRTRIAVLLLATFGTLQADTLSYTTTPSSGGLLYQFTLANTGSTGGPLFDLFLSVPLDLGNIDTATIGRPVGWGDPTGGLLFFGSDVNPATSFIQWAAAASGLYDLAVGGSLSGFDFQASQPAAGPITFALNGSTTFATAQEVPEPAALILTLIGIAILGISRAAGINRRFD